MRRAVDDDVTLRLEVAQVALLSNATTADFAETDILLAKGLLIVGIDRPLLGQIERLPQGDHMKPLIMLIDTLERQRRKWRMVAKLHGPRSVDVDVLPVDLHGPGTFYQQLGALQ